MSPELQMHALVEGSRANGPGRRIVVWTQGCSLGCPGCFNPQTHPSAGGEGISIETLAARIAHLQDAHEGVTISGGEPLEQFEPVALLVQQIRGATDLSILMFTGFTWPQVQRMPRAERVLESLDVLICGRFDRSRRLAEGLRGSANKTVHLLTELYTMDDLEAVPPAEVMISPAGDVLATGIDPLILP